MLREAVVSSADSGISTRRYGLAAFSCTGLGWLAGPSVGSFFWRMVYRRAVSVILFFQSFFHQVLTLDGRPAMEIKDKEFYEHVKRMRKLRFESHVPWSVMS